MIVCLCVCLCKNCFLHEHIIYLPIVPFFPALPERKTPEAQLSRASCPGVGAEMEIRRREGLGKERSGWPGRMGWVSVEFEKMKEVAFLLESTGTKDGSNLICLVMNKDDVMASFNNRMF